MEAGSGTAAGPPSGTGPFVKTLMLLSVVWSDWPPGFVIPTHNAIAVLLLMPLTATLVYACLSRVEGWERVPVAKVLMYWVTAPLGAAMFVWAFCRSVLKEEKRRP